MKTQTNERVEFNLMPEKRLRQMRLDIALCSIWDMVGIIGTVVRLHIQFNISSPTMAFECHKMKIRLTCQLGDMK